MSRLLSLLLVCCLSVLTGCIVKVPGTSTKNPIVKASPFQQLDFLSLIQRYVKKEKLNPIEGVYSVSGSVTKKGKGFLGSNPDKEKVTDVKENYAKVALLKDDDHYIELSLDQEGRSSYSIIGEFTETSGSSILIYKHMDNKGKSTSFTFTRDEKADVLEGVRVESNGGSTITYKLTYLKLAPK